MAQLRADTQRNRQAVLSAALSLLAGQGDLTMAEVAGGAGVTRATLYRHFVNREDLIAAALRQVGGEIVADLLLRMDGLAATEALQVLAHEAITSVERFAPLLTPAADRLPDFARTAVSDEPLSAWLATRRARGELTNPIPDDWLASLVRVVVLDMVARVLRAELDAERATELLAQALIRLVV